MSRIPTAAIGAIAILAMSTSVASASAPIRGITVKGGHNPHLTAGQLGHRFIVSFPFPGGAASWAYDPATGGLNQLPTPEEQSKPLAGIGIVVKKNPGSSAARFTASSNGTTFDLPATMDPGNYDVVISLPAHAVNTKGTGTTRMAGGSSGGSKPATITFHITVTSTCESNQQPTPAATPKQKTWLCSNFRVDPSHPPTVVVGSGASSSQ
jgi:hypothetical protein